MRKVTRATAVAVVSKIILNTLYPIIGAISKALHATCSENSNQIVIGSKHGKSYSDNSKYFYEWATNQADYRHRILWITRSRRVFLQLSSADMPVAYLYSRRAIHALLTAKSFVISYRVQDVCLLPPMLRKTARVVHLGHGVAFKRYRASLPQFVDNEPLFAHELRILAGYETTYISGSKFVTPYDAESQMLSRSQCRAFGLPRTDHLWKEVGPLNADDGPIRVLVAPTWRKRNSGSSTLPAWLFDENLDAVLSQYNSCLFVRLHPKSVGLDYLSLTQLIEKRQNVHSFSFEEVPDVNAHLQSFHALVTDYSSLLVDFSILARPIGIALDPLEINRSLDGLFYADSVAAAFSTVATVNQLEDFLRDARSGRVSRKYLALRSLLHDDAGEASARVATLL